MRLSKRIKRDVEKHAIGSIYRLNAKTADCYAFNLCYNASGKLDFEGGWDWSDDLIDKEAQYLFLLHSREFKRIR